MLATATIVCTRFSYKTLSCGQLTLGHLSEALFLTFVPTPLVLLTDLDGTQNVHIAPEAFDVSSAAFGNETLTWEKALPEGVTLKSVRTSLALKLLQFSLLVCVLYSFRAQRSSRSMVKIHLSQSMPMHRSQAVSKALALDKIGMPSFLVIMM